MDHIKTLGICFNALLVISIISVLLLLMIYIRVGRNSLLLFCSLVLLLMFGVMLAGSFHDDLARQERFCLIQGVILNYCFICIHALIACMMYDAWKHVSNWRPRRQSTALNKEKKRCCSPGYWIISFGLPFVPTLILGIFLFQSTKLSDTRIEMKLVQPQAFFCYISSSELLQKISTSTGWFMLFSIPGIFFSVYLLFKTIWMREKSLRRGRTTHLTRLSVVRVALATFIYSTFALASFLPALIIYDEKWPASDLLVGLPELLTGSPKLDPSLCNNVLLLNDSRAVFYASQRCPTVSSYIPCSIGIGFFLMYGFGKHARKSYIEFYKRWSILPLFNRLLTFLRLQRRKRQQQQQQQAGSDAYAGPEANANSLEQHFDYQLEQGFGGSRNESTSTSTSASASDPQHHQIAATASTLSALSRRTRPLPTQGLSSTELASSTMMMQGGGGPFRKGEGPMPFSRRVSYDVTSGRLMTAMVPHSGNDQEAHLPKDRKKENHFESSESGQHMSPLRREDGFSMSRHSNSPLSPHMMATGTTTPNNSQSHSLHPDTVSLTFNEAVRLIHPLYSSKNYMKDFHKKWMTPVSSSTSMVKESSSSTHYHPSRMTTTTTTTTTAPEVLLSMALQTTKDLPSPHMSFIHSIEDEGLDEDLVSGRQYEEKENRIVEDTSCSPQPALLFDLHEKFMVKRPILFFQSSPLYSKMSAKLVSEDDRQAISSTRPIPFRVRSPPNHASDFESKSDSESKSKSKSADRDAQSELFLYDSETENEGADMSSHPLYQLPFSKSCPF